MTTHKFLLKDITGTSGRLDIICRCLIAAFSLGYEEIEFHTVLHGPPNPPVALEFDGSILKALPHDEISLARLLQQLLDPKASIPLGIQRSKKTFINIVQDLRTRGPVLLLKEGYPHISLALERLSRIKPIPKALSFVLSDLIDLTSEEEAILISELECQPVGLGRQSYLASHCIILLRLALQPNEFNRRK